MGGLSGVIAGLAGRKKALILSAIVLPFTLDRWRAEQQSFVSTGAPIGIRVGPGGAVDGIADRLELATAFGADAVIISAARTAIGTARKGTLLDVTAFDLAKESVGEALGVTVDEPVADVESTLGLPPPERVQESDEVYLLSAGGTDAGFLETWASGLVRLEPGRVPWFVQRPWAVAQATVSTPKATISVPVSSRAGPATSQASRLARKTTSCRRASWDARSASSWRLKLR